MGARVNGIAVLQGLPAVLFQGVTAHELGHVWLIVHGIQDLPNWAEEGFCELLSYRYYTEMATDKVDGWDTSKYQSPLFFLNLLRRHACTGAFSHPKYGGNSAGSGWAYLAERYTDPQSGNSLFQWRDAVEKPLGNSADYLG